MLPGASKKMTSTWPNIYTKLVEKHRTINFSVAPITIWLVFGIAMERKFKQAENQKISSGSTRLSMHTYYLMVEQVLIEIYLIISVLIFYDCFQMLE